LPPEENDEDEVDEDEEEEPVRPPTPPRVGSTKKSKHVRTLISYKFHEYSYLVF
jgi:hypothetical protein